MSVKYMKMLLFRQSKPNVYVCIKWRNIHLIINIPRKITSLTKVKKFRNGWQPYLWSLGGERRSWTGPPTREQDLERDLLPWEQELERDLLPREQDLEWDLLPWEQDLEWDLLPWEQTLECYLFPWEQTLEWDLLPWEQDLEWDLLPWEQYLERDLPTRAMTVFIKTLTREHKCNGFR